jgi:hypothetical protein
VGICGVTRGDLFITHSSFFSLLEGKRRFEDGDDDHLDERKYMTDDVFFLFEIEQTRR